MAIYVALGANLGDRAENIKRALELMPPEVEVEAVSPVYESEPQPPAPPPSYLNAVCRVRTGLSPRALLGHFKDIEQRMGRTDAPRWDPRLIDLDIVLYDGLVIDEPDLKVPHPQLELRNFVLQPLLDLDSELVHPVTGERLEDVLARVGLDGLRKKNGTISDRPTLC